jgi:hypothetical protein
VRKTLNEENLTMIKLDWNPRNRILNETSFNIKQWVGISVPGPQREALKTFIIII